MPLTRRPMTGSTSSSASTISWTRRASATRSACQDGILTKLITPIAAPVPYALFQAPPEVPARRPEHRASCMVAPHALDAFLAFTRARRRRDRLQRRDRHDEDEARACRRPTSWPGTTPRCGRCASIRRSPICRSLYPFPNQLDAGRDDRRAFRRRGAGASRIRPLRRQDHLLRPAAGALHHRGAARRDHPHPRGQWLLRSSTRTATRWRRAA